MPSWTLRRSDEQIICYSWPTRLAHVKQKEQSGDQTIAREQDAAFETIAYILYPQLQSDDGARAQNIHPVE
jgi:hypothetical protein